MDSIYEFICLQNDVFIKNQQRDEPKLEMDEKKRIVGELYASKPSTFLYRYYKYLTTEQLQNIKQDAGDDDDKESLRKEIDRYIEIKNLSTKTERQNNALVKNRRMAAVEKMLEEDKYFSLYEMQYRHPYLFDKYIGRYMSPEERKDFKEKCNAQNYTKSNWSSYLLEQIRQGDLRQRFFDEEFFEEGEDDDDNNDQDNEEGEEEEDKEGFKEDDQERPQDDEDSRDGTGNEKDNNKKDRLRREFMFIMIQNFIDGKDGEHFDYSAVDNNDKFDMTKEFERDVEDRYFEDDD